MLFRRKRKNNLHIPEQIVTVWSPSGNNTAKVSWLLANELSKLTGVALVELPCLGIPRLAVEANILNRSKHTDSAIIDYERRNGCPIDFSHQITDHLTILPANPYALPDHPVVHKIERLETLKSFPSFFVNQARKKGYNLVLFDCQGVVTSPMTFFALRQSKKIILVVDGPSDLAWSLINLQRLTETYGIAEENFVATTISPATKDYLTEIKKVLPCPVLNIDNISLFLAEEQNVNDICAAPVKQVISG